MRVLGLMLVLALYAPAAVADFKTDYREGVEAAERKDWATVDARMRQALNDQPVPNPRVRLYGMRFDPYLPHYYLGLAAFSRNDCKAALGHFSNAAHQSAIASVPALRDQQKRMTDRCQAAVAQTPPAPPAATASTTPPKPAPSAATASTTPPKPAPAKPTTPAPTSAPKADPVAAQPTPSAPVRPNAADLAAAQRTAASTKAAIDLSGREIAAAPANAAWSGQQRTLSSEWQRLNGEIPRADKQQLAAITRQLNTLASRATALQKSVQTAKAAAAEQLRVARARLESSLSAASALAARAGADGEALNGTIAQARRQSNGDDLAAIVDAARALDAATAALDARLRARQAQLAARAAIAPLVEAFLRGDFSTAATWRDDPALRELPAARAQLLLLRAAASYELYVLGAESNDALIEASRRDIRLARQLDSKADPRQRAFSPRFYALFARTR